MDTANVPGAQGIKSIPPAVWAIAVVGGLGVSFYLSKKKGTTTNTTATDPTALIYTGVGNGTAGTTPDTGSTGNPQTNDDWAQRAKTYLISKGDDPAAVDAAINKYLAGQALNQQENALISRAIGGVGPTPQTLPPATGGTTGDTTYTWEHPIQQQPGSAINTSQYGMKNGTFYTVKPGDTLQSIAKQAYGIGNGDYGSLAQGEAEIYNANAYKVADIKTLTPGMTLYLPLIISEMFVHQGPTIPLGGGAKPGAEKNEFEFLNGSVPTSAAYYGSSSELEAGRPNLNIPRSN